MLRRSMLALIDKGGGYAHPANWAPPFVVLGEGWPVTSLNGTFSPSKMRETAEARRKPTKQAMAKLTPELTSLARSHCDAIEIKAASA